MKISKKNDFSKKNEYSNFFKKKPTIIAHSYKKKILPHTLSN